MHEWDILDIKRGPYPLLKATIFGFQFQRFNQFYGFLETVDRNILIP